MTSRFQNLARSYALPAGLFLVVWIVMLASRTGLGDASIFPVLDSYALLGLVALGVAVTMIAGELDLSAVSMAALAGVISVKAQSLGLFGALVVATLVGGAIGGLQGYLIHRFEISSIFFTISTLILLRGVAMLLGHDNAVLVDDPTMGDPLLTRWGILSLSIIIAIAVVAVVGVFLGYVRWGREIHAVGGDRPEAAATGVSVGRALVTTFLISGACAALAGSIAAYKGGSADPQAFAALLLPAVTAAVVGGIALAGGRGTVVNVLLGVGILASITAGIAARGAADEVTQLITGLLLVVVIAGEWLTGRLDERRLMRAAMRGVGTGRSA